MSDKTLSSDSPVTAITTRRIKPGRESDYETWLAEVIQDMSQTPGYQGINIIRPEHQSGDEYVFIAHFDCYENLRIWEKSPERARLLERLDPLLTEGQPKFQMQSGLEFWFTSPARAVVPPPQWKMVIVTILVIWPLSSLIVAILGPVLEMVPAFFRGLVITGFMILLMTYLVMPWVMKLFAFWLFPAPDR